MAEAFTIDGITHVIGDENCSECYGSESPLRCQCGGLIHEGFIDESHDSVITKFVCDECGGDEDNAAH